MKIQVRQGGGADPPTAPKALRKKTLVERQTIETKTIVIDLTILHSVGCGMISGHKPSKDQGRALIPVFPPAPQLFHCSGYAITTDPSRSFPTESGAK